MLGLRIFSRCVEWGLFFVVVPGLLIAAAPLTAEHRLQSMGLVAVVLGLSCPSAYGIFLDQGSEAVSPALAGGFLSTGPPGKSRE